MKSKRSKEWNMRMYRNLIDHVCKADPDKAFEFAVMGEDATRARYTHRDLKNMLHEIAARKRRTQAGQAQVYGAGGGGAGGTSFTVPAGVGAVHITCVGGGGGGGKTP
jgi:hypothetical protein